MTIAELVVEIGVKLDNFQSGMQAASQSLEGFLSVAQTTTRDLARVGIGMQAFGAVIAGGLALAINEAAKAEQQFTLLKAAIEGSQQVLDITQFQRQAKALQSITSFSDEAVTAIQRLLITFNLTQQQVEELTPRVLNLATTLGIDTETAARALGRAMTSGVSSLKKLGVTVDETLDPIRDFDQLLQQLDRTTGQSAEAARNNLTGAIAAFRNAISDLSESLGGPALAPITNFINSLTRAATSLNELSNRFPAATAAATGFLAALAAFATIGGGILLFLANLNKIPALIGAARFGFVLLLEGVVAIGGVLATWVIPLLAAAAVFVVLNSLAAKFNSKIRELLERQTGLSFIDERNARFLQLLERLHLVERKERGIGEGVSEVLRERERESGVLREQLSTLTEIEARQRTIAAEIEAQANQGRLSASQRATSALQAGGLGQGQLEAIEEERTRGFESSERNRLRLLEASLVRQREATRKAILQEGETEEIRANKIAQIDAEIAQTRLRFSESYRVEADKVARAIVESERNAAAARLDLYRTELQVRTDLTRQSSDVAVQAARDQVDALSDIRQAELARFQLVEETRLGLLRRSIDTEITLRKNAVTIQEAQNRLATTRERRSLEIRNAIRADLVKQGFFSQAEADDIARAEEDKIATAGLQREIELERQKLALSESTAQREIQLALAERDSRLSILGAETEARKAQIRLNAQLRIFDLQNAVLVAKAETEAKILELKAQAKATIELKKAELAGRRDRGLLTPDEEKGRQGEIDAIARGAGLQEAALLEGQQKREESLTRATRSINDQLARQTVFADQELASRRASIAQESALAIAKIESDRVANIQIGLANIAALESQIPERLGATVDQITRVAASGMRTLTELFTTFANGATGVLKPLGDLIDKIKLGPGGGFSIPGAPSAPNVPTITPPAPGGFAPGQQQFSQVINVNGTQAHFQGDRQALVETALQMLLGPEGARAFDEFMRRRPGPRTSTAGG